MIDSQAILAILFVVAKEFKTTDAEKLQEINVLIQLSYNELPIGSLNINANTAVAYLTAYKMSLQSDKEKNKGKNVAGQMTRIKEGDFEAEFKSSSGSSAKSSLYSENDYGKQLKTLLDNIPRKIRVISL